MSESADGKQATAAVSETPQVWKSRLGWRIMLSVFATILVVRTSILAITIGTFETDRLSDLREAGRVSVAPLLAENSVEFKSPLRQQDAERLMRITSVKGLAVYGLDFSLLQTFGEATILKPSDIALNNGNYRSVDKKRFETILMPADLGRPYTIVTKIDSSNLEHQVWQYVKENIVIVLLMSAFVTAVLMIALAQWLLEPLLLLRRNLLSAARNPENPNIQKPAQETNDEVGTVMRIANDLISQNAQNLQRLRTHAEDKIHKLAFYDALTGLPNRTLFMERLEEAIASAVLKEDKRLAILSMDIDHFKDINDTMGHETGDKLLEALGKRLVNAVPEGSLVARSSADEFIIMVYLEGDHADSTRIVEQIFSMLSEPVSILQERFQVRASIGVARAPEDGIDPSQVLKHADIALNRAKQEGRNTACHYSEDFDRAVQQRFAMLRDLRNALDQNQFLLNYHPQFDLKTGALIGAEVLLRWFRPDSSKEGGHYVPPIEFIPLAEQSGLIVPIGEWILKTACRTNKQWQDRGLPPFRIAVNLSGVQFYQGNIVDVVATAVRETRLDPKWLELEITESVFIDDVESCIKKLNALHSFGVELSIDDFGTGYSSLSYLRQFPIDRLKIDQSFTRNSLANPDDKAITKTIITLGHSLGLKVIAEGVETQDHEDFLKEEGCDEVQGFKYARPLPAEQMWEFARNWAAEFKPRAIK